MKIFPFLNKSGSANPEPGLYHINISLTVSHVTVSQKIAPEKSPDSGNNFFGTKRQILNALGMQQIILP